MAPVSILACLAILMVSQVDSTCPPEAATFNYEQKLRTSDLVFRGIPVSGSSSLAVNDDLEEVVFGSSTLQVRRFFKTPGKQQNSDITIHRTYHQSDPCEQQFFTGVANSRLVFANQTSPDFYAVSACGFSFPWECVPVGARRMLYRRRD